MLAAELLFHVGVDLAKVSSFSDPSFHAYRIFLIYRTHSNQSPQHRKLIFLRFNSLNAAETWLISSLRKDPFFERLRLPLPPELVKLLILFMLTYFFVLRNLLGAVFLAALPSPYYVSTLPTYFDCSYVYCSLSTVGWIVWVVRRGGPLVPLPPSA